MDLTSLLAIMALAGLAAYVQTLTGFAFGLLMMGGVALTGALYLPDAAVLVSVLTSCNALVVLARDWRHIAWREFKLAIPATTIGLLFGYWLLEVLAESSLDWIRLALGLVILVSSVQLWLKPQPLAQRSSSGSFFGFGLIGGVMGGLFSTSGPPLIYHLYRQPFPHHVIRETLVTIFFFNALVRLGVVTASGNLPPLSTWWTLLCIPVVLALT